MSDDAAIAALILGSNGDCTKIFGDAAAHADVATLKRSYKRMALRVHPDKNTHADAGTKRDSFRAHRHIRLGAFGEMRRSDSAERCLHDATLDAAAIGIDRSKCGGDVKRCGPVIGFAWRSLLKHAARLQNRQTIRDLKRIIGVVRDKDGRGLGFGERRQCRVAQFRA